MVESAVTVAPLGLTPLLNTTLVSGVAVEPPPPLGVNWPFSNGPLALLVPNPNPLLFVICTLNDGLLLPFLKFALTLVPNPAG